MGHVYQRNAIIDSTFVSAALPPDFVNDLSGTQLHHYLSDAHQYIQVMSLSFTCKKNELSIKESNIKVFKTFWGLCYPFLIYL